MRLARHDDPWEKDKNIPDPWDSPRYRQRVKHPYPPQSTAQSSRV